MEQNEQADTEEVQTQSTGEKLEGDNRLLIVEDDLPFQQRLARAMEKRGFETYTSNSVNEALSQVELLRPAFAVVDMRLEDGNGLTVIEAIHEHRPDSRAIILTGYGNIASAVAAIKVGAVDYLSKPADPEEIYNALIREREVEDSPPPPENPMSADRVRWEHIQRVFELCDRNVSETARRLNMHRRTLQRILAKRAPR